MVCKEFVIISEDQAMRQTGADIYIDLEVVGASASASARILVRTIFASSKSLNDSLMSERLKSNNKVERISTFYF
mgnify:CR=1 FL=1